MKWCFTVMALLIAAAWVFSTQRTVFFMAQFGDSYRLAAGGIDHTWSTKQHRLQMSALTGVPLDLQWRYYDSPRQFPMQWWGDFYYTSSTLGRKMVFVPLWVPFVLSSGAAAWFWTRRRGHEVVDGCKKCGYDLRGLRKDAPCPECGADAAR